MASLSSERIGSWRTKQGWVGRIRCRRMWLRPWYTFVVGFAIIQGQGGRNESTDMSPRLGISGYFVI